MSELLAVCAIRVHFPQLATRKVGNLASAFYPCGVALALGASGEHTLGSAVHVHYMQGLLPFVFFYAVVTYLVYHLLAIGRNLSSTYASHSP